jgi:hypothetical protein
VFALQYVFWHSAHRHVPTTSQVRRRARPDCDVNSEEDCREVPAACPVPFEILSRCEHTAILIAATASAREDHAAADVSQVSGRWSAAASRTNGRSPDVMRPPAAVTELESSIVSQATFSDCQRSWFAELNAMRFTRSDRAVARAAAAAAGSGCTGEGADINWRLSCVCFACVLLFSTCTFIALDRERDWAAAFTAS